MDAVEQIKSRLPIEELVRQYCQLQRKGRNYVGLCPFHQDSRPSFVVSPDKGICYCFPCQKGGDIFSFYQLVENVDFPQALHDLAERTGVQLPDRRASAAAVDERDRLRAVLVSAAAFYRDALAASPKALEYLDSRGVTKEQQKQFGLGLAPPSFSATYDHLLKSGHSRSDALSAGIAATAQLQDEKAYDRFRNRLMFPISDSQGRIIGFGGRDMEDILPTGDSRESAKYLNSAETPLYHKSNVLYGLYEALPAIRKDRRAVLVEGYFDVLACHRCGVECAVGTCGTALTPEHVRLLKRYADTIVLCMDSDDAGVRAADRACCLAQEAGLQVERAVLHEKDPADAALENGDALRSALTEHTKPFIVSVCDEIVQQDLSQPAMRRNALDRLLPLLRSVVSSTERTHMVRVAASALRTTEVALLDDLRSANAPVAAAHNQSIAASSPYSAGALSAALLLLYPSFASMAHDVLETGDPLADALLSALKTQDAGSVVTLESLALPTDIHSQAAVLLLFCEQSGFAEWSEGAALQEIRRNIKIANRDAIVRKQRTVTASLAAARKEGRKADEQQLAEEYVRILQHARTL